MNGVAHQINQKLVSSSIFLTHGNEMHKTNSKKKKYSVTAKTDEIFTIFKSIRRINYLMTYDKQIFFVVYYELVESIMNIKKEETNPGSLINVMKFSFVFFFGI